MLNSAFLYDSLAAKGVEYTVGVPDSLLKYYCNYAFDQGNKTITANEGGAIGLAMGYHLATGKVPLVYMQNSGFGNIVNPITSLADEEVYSIPMLLMIGWRGMPGASDEPQHIKQGRAMEALLKALEIPYCILADEETKAKDQIEQAFSILRRESKPYALLVPPNTFEEYKLTSNREEPIFSLKREEALDVLLDSISDVDIVVSTTGKTSREVFELRDKKGKGNHRDFLTVGGMGHASQIALGIALEQPKRNVICIDGDGAALMHMGSFAIIGEKSPDNFKHVIINNGAHESVGGQPTIAFDIDFKTICKGCGYKKVFKATNKDELEALIPEFISSKGPVLLEIMTCIGARKDLGRPTISPVENKKDFMRFVTDPNQFQQSK